MTATHDTSRYHRKVLPKALPNPDDRAAWSLDARFHRICDFPSHRASVREEQGEPFEEFIVAVRTLLEGPLGQAGAEEAIDRKRTVMREAHMRQTDPAFMVQELLDAYFNPA
ncbi:hypothetical protein [Mycetocola zhadangensis]|uniref:Uncharacterized protein n=1 Tax=Mycetocola zhadangensis TaxID=1164595 RepID=A0A3L7J6P6_9MICO|nr:hypothetical protein [Mycetocola zhadangensis]RLQ86184.1 hypothetical protein D9V28_04945 [Mycetocola zhadangensis]GGE89093.1 hypothetical protein GCM10011313_09750 [Mycetocola zhadangensis]